MSGMNKVQPFYFSLFILLLLACFSIPASAQVPVLPDSAVAEPEEVLPLEGRPVPITERAREVEELPVEEVDSLSPLNPATAAFYSAILPGLGQAYNNSHWKIPLIYIGGAIFVWRVNSLNQMYSISRRNLRLILFEDTVTEIAGFDQSQWDRFVKKYRRDRDYMIILGGVFYAMNIIEAYVDAHLQDFNVNDDLAIRIKPALMAGTGGNAGAGIALTLTIK